MFYLFAGLALTAMGVSFLAMFVFPTGASAPNWALFLVPAGCGAAIGFFVFMMINFTK